MILSPAKLNLSLNVNGLLENGYHSISSYVFFLDLFDKIDIIESPLNNVLIGGQAGISGHLKVGDNVQIGGGSGVIKNIPSNTKVMGYPAKNIRNFLKDNKIND